MSPGKWIIPAPLFLSPLSSLPQESPRWGTLCAPFALYQHRGSPWEVPGSTRCGDVVRVMVSFIPRQHVQVVPEENETGVETFY